MDIVSFDIKIKSQDVLSQQILTQKCNQKKVKQKIKLLIYDVEYKWLNQLIIL